MKVLDKSQILNQEQQEPKKTNFYVKEIFFDKFLASMSEIFVEQILAVSFRYFGIQSCVHSILINLTMPFFGGFVSVRTAKICQTEISPMLVPEFDE